MITKELQINGQPTDLTDTVAITVKGPDLAEMRSGAAYSNTFKLPFTRKNSIATGQAGNVNITPSGSGVPASLTIGGIDALSGSGQAFVRGADRDGYSVDVKGGAYTFFDLLKNTQLVDLPGWSALDFNYTNTDILARMVVGADFAVPMIDWGRQPTIGSYTVVDNTGNIVAYPALRLEAIITQIVNGLGYEVLQYPAGGTWAKLYVPFNKEILRNGTRYIDANSDSYTKTAVTLSSASDAISVGAAQYRYIFLGSLPNVDLDTFFIDTITRIDAHTLTVNSGTLTVYSLEVVALPIGTIPGGGSPIQTAIVSTGPLATGTLPFPAKDQALSTQTQLNAGTGVDMYLQIRVVAATAANIAYNIPLLSGDGTITPRAIVNRTGYKCTPEAVLPDWDCAQMMRAALVQAGAFITVDEQAKQVSIMTADQVAALEGFASDWGRKFADTVPVPMATDYRGFRATNYLRFTNDNDVSEGLGNGQFAVTTGDGQAGLYLQSAFSPSAKAQLSITSATCARIIHWQPSSDNASWQEYSTNTVRLILCNSWPAGALTVRINNVAYTAPAPAVGVFEDYYLQGIDATLDYAANGVYQTVARWANEGRRFTAKFLLSLNDIQSMHLMQTVAGYNLCGILRPVHVPQLGATCLIESISQWVDDQTPCEVTLLKIG